MHYIAIFTPKCVLNLHLFRPIHDILGLRPFFFLSLTYDMTNLLDVFMRFIEKTFRVYRTESDRGPKLPKTIEQAIIDSLPKSAKSPRTITKIKKGAMTISAIEDKKQKTLEKSGLIQPSKKSKVAEGTDSDLDDDDDLPMSPPLSSAASTTKNMLLNKPRTPSTIASSFSTSSSSSSSGSAGGVLSRATATPRVTTTTNDNHQQQQF